MNAIASNLSAVLLSACAAKLSPQLAWSHYRVLTKVADADAWAFYERETVVGGYGLYGAVVVAKLKPNRRNRKTDRR